MAEHHHFVRSDGRIIDVAWTNTNDGDFHIDSPRRGLAERRAEVMAGRWAVVRQVHGSAVVDASAALLADVPVEADGIVTAAIDQPISVQGADCAPIAFITASGPIGVAHAGWRGLASGIVQSVTERLAQQGGMVESAVIGPVICTDCYEFGANDLDAVAAELGDQVRATTADGSPALDMRAGLIAAFDAVDVTNVSFVAGCPSCDNTGFSHRARSEKERHCLVARLTSEVELDPVSTETADG